MTPQELEKEVQFGLENLEKVKRDIDDFQTSPATPQMRNSALVYACMGYFNALEHLMIRVLKFLKLTLPAGSASHQMILTEFQHALNKLNISFIDFNIFKRLLGFRHVATKIYGFLIEEDKLAEVVTIIQTNHKAFVGLFQEITQNVSNNSP
jgi:hypothetical protein